MPRPLVRRALLRRFLLPAVVLAAGVLAAPATAQAPEPRSVVEIADSLLAAQDLEGAYAALVARLQVAPDDHEALGRATRAALGFGILGADAQTRLTWLRTADAHGRELLRVRPDDPDAMAWAAAALGRRAIAEGGARTVAGLAKEVWAITDRLLAMDPSHPLGNHVRGKLHQEVRRFNAVKRLFARLFLGSDVVSRASWARAEEHFQRAVDGDPTMVLFYLDLGETYRYQGKTEQALAAYRRGLTVPDRLPVDARFKRTMQRRIATLTGSAGTP